MRRDELARITGAPQAQSNRAGKMTGSPETRRRNVTGTAPAHFAASVISCIRPHIIFTVPPGIARGQYQAIYTLRLLPNGDHAGAPERVKSSGLPAYDQAVERAIVRCDPVPRPADMNPHDMPRELRLIFDPVDDNANK